jgi:hypothetical protein
MLPGVSRGRQSFGSGSFGRGAGWRPIPRPGLLARIAAAAGPVVLLGGSGAGKSTLLDAWEAAHPGGLVVVAAQTDPGIAGALFIGAAELAFAEDETYQVLAATLGDAEAADALAPDLHLLTNGWPALVALAGAWLGQQAPGERRGRLRGLARVEAGLAEHLVPQVIGGLGGEERELLRRLVWLPAVDAATADRLDLTENLRGVAPFIQGLARRPGWFTVPTGWKTAVQQALPLPAAAVAELRRAYAEGM